MLTVLPPASTSSARCRAIVVVGESTTRLSNLMTSEASSLAGRPRFFSRGGKTSLYLLRKDSHRLCVHSGIRRCSWTTSADRPWYSRLKTTSQRSSLPCMKQAGQGRVGFARAARAAPSSHERDEQGEPRETRENVLARGARKGARRESAQRFDPPPTPPPPHPGVILFGNHCMEMFGDCAWPVCI